MQLNHIGINITDETDIQRFYEEILGFQRERDFSIAASIARQFFAIHREVKIFLLKKGQFKLELFVHDEPVRCGFSHLCIEVDNRETIIQQCKAKGFPVLRMKRENGDLIFIQDTSGNRFELKNNIS